MHERDGVRLMQYLDGTLPSAERQAVEAWLSVDAEARRVAAEHRALWDLLGEADLARAPTPSEEFRSRTLVRAREPGFAGWKPRFAALMAASVLVAVVVFAWNDAASRSTLAAEDLHVVGNLHLLENFELAQRHGTVLDDVVYAAVLREFPGDAPGFPSDPLSTLGVPR